MSNTLADLRRELKRCASPARAKASKWFFKTGRGQYSEGDIFMGVATADMRAVAKRFSGLTYPNIARLLNSKMHEQRQVALLILVHQYERGTPKECQRIFRFYLKSTRRINNWDLVDLSAPKIVGSHLIAKSPVLLVKLVRSHNLWERRIAVLATLAFIRHGEYLPTLRLARLLLHDQHDLIHKAVGWMLREVGKRSQPTLEKFLKQYARRMPRTMLRYAIERLPQAKRRLYLSAQYIQTVLTV